MIQRYPKLAYYLYLIDARGDVCNTALDHCLTPRIRECSQPMNLHSTTLETEKNSKLIMLTLNFIRILQYPIARGC